MDYFSFCLYRFEGTMEVHFDRGTMETEGKRGYKMFMETSYNRFFLFIILGTLRCPTHDYSGIAFNLTLGPVNKDFEGFVKEFRSLD